MKFLSYLSLILVTNLLYASADSPLNGFYLTPSSEAVFTLAADEIDLNSVTSWESKINADEVLVKVFSPELSEIDNSVLIYACHLNDETMECLKKDHDQQMDHNQQKDFSITNDLKLQNNNNQVKTESDFEQLKAVNKMALAKLYETFILKKINPNSLSSIKVWKVLGHGSHYDFWTKVIYMHKGEKKINFVQCHQQHDDNEKFRCIYKTEARTEPGSNDKGKDGHEGH